MNEHGITWPEAFVLASAFAALTGVMWACAWACVQNTRALREGRKP